MSALPALRKFQRDLQPRPPGDFPQIDELLKRYPRVHLEIGSGVGYFAIQLAMREPSIGLISMEHTRAKFESFERRIQNHGRPVNLCALHLNAVSAVTHLIPDASIERVYLNYPNPNPKNPALRWIRMPFFSEVLRVLKRDGHIQLLSNIEEYIEEARTAARDYWGLETTQDFSFGLNDVPGGAPRTHFEKKYLQNGERCFQLELKKTAF